MGDGFDLGRWAVGLYPVANLPLVEEGADVGRLISEAAAGDGFAFHDGDIVVAAHKIVSKAEGAVVRLADVEPSPRAHDLARATGRDPRLCEVYIRESAEILGTSGPMVITRHRLGFRCTNAGVDRSNVAPDRGDAVLTLPRDPDASARRIRAGLRARSGHDVAAIITDSFGLPDRYGAIGLAGIRHLEERDSQDLYGRKAHSALMLVDALAGAAAMLIGEIDEPIPAVVVRGVRYTRDEAAAIRGLLV
jgi:coenzyme F420-0:L-glutamate ligase/coenzyme F420-1:gamma-L-glutamate ligase